MAATHRLRDLALGDAVRQLAAVGAQDQGRAAPRVRARRQPLRFGRRGDALRRARQRRAATSRSTASRCSRYLGYLPRDLPAQLRAATLERRPADRLRAAADAVAQAERRASTRAGSTWSTRPRRTCSQVANVKVADRRAAAVRAPAAAGARRDRRAARRRGARRRGRRQPAARRPRRRRRRRRTASVRPAAPSAVRRLPRRGRQARRAPPRRAPARRRRARRAWRLSLEALSLHGGRVDWRDASIAPRAELALADLAFEAQSIAWPIAAPVPFRGEATVGGTGAGERGKLTCPAAATARPRASRSASTRCRSRCCGLT